MERIFFYCAMKFGAGEFMKEGPPSKIKGALLDLPSTTGIWDVGTATSEAQGKIFMVDKDRLPLIDSIMGIQYKRKQTKDHVGRKVWVYESVVERPPNIPTISSWPGKAASAAYTGVLE